MSNNVIQLTNETYKPEVLQSDIPVLVDFYSDGCVPCQMLAPIFDALAEKYAGKVKFCKLDVAQHKTTALTNRVMSIPTLFFVKGGEITERVTGALPESIMDEKIQAML